MQTINCANFNGSLLPTHSCFIIYFNHLTTEAITACYLLDGKTASSNFDVALASFLSHYQTHMKQQKRQNHEA